MTGADLIALLKKHPIGFICAALCLGCIGAWYFRSDAVSETRQELEAAAKEDDAIATDVHNARDLPLQLEAMQVAAKQLDTRVVHATQLATNLQFFYRLESETGVKLVDIRQLPLPVTRTGAAAKSHFIPIPFTLTIQGSYKQVMDFLGHLEKGQRFSRLHTATFSKGSRQDATGGEMTVNLSLDLLGTP